jgi:hypothetical protein
MNARGLFWTAYAVMIGGLLVFIAGGPWAALMLGLLGAVWLAMLIYAAFD